MCNKKNIVIALIVLVGLSVLGAEDSRSVFLFPINSTGVKSEDVTIFEEEVKESIERMGFHFQNRKKVRSEMVSMQIRSFDQIVDDEAIAMGEKTGVELFVSLTLSTYAGKVFVEISAIETEKGRMAIERKIEFTRRNHEDAAYYVAYLLANWKSGGDDEANPTIRKYSKMDVSEADLERARKKDENYFVGAIALSIISGGMLTVSSFALPISAYYLYWSSYASSTFIAALAATLISGGIMLIALVLVIPMVALYYSAHGGVKFSYRDRKNSQKEKIVMVSMFSEGEGAESSFGIKFAF